MHVRAARFEGIDTANIDRDIERVPNDGADGRRARGDLGGDVRHAAIGRQARHVAGRSLEGTSLDLVFTDNAQDAQRVHEALDAMSRPEGAGRRTSVQTFELLMDEQLG